MRRTLFVVTMILVLTALSSAVALAEGSEDNKVVFCGNLSQEDCDLLVESQTALWTLTSGESAQVISVYAQNSAELAPSAPVVSFTSRSAFVADPAILARMLELQQSDLDELAADPETLLEATLLPLSIDTASSTTVALSPKIKSMIAEMLGRDLPEELVFETRLIDGVLYVNLERLGEVVPQIGSMGDWVGVDLTAFVPRITQESIANGSFDMESLEDALAPPGQRMMAQPYLVMVNPEMEPAFNTFLEILPLRNADINEQSAAVYRMQMDVPSYTRSPAFAERMSGATQVVNNALPQAGQSSEANIGTRLVQGVGTVLLRNTDAEVTQAIGFDNAYLLAQNMSVRFGVAGWAFALDIESANANMDALSAIPAPSNAVVLPIRLIIGLIDTFSSRQ